MLAFFSCPLRSETHQSVFYLFTVNIIMVPALQYLLLFICVRILNTCISKEIPEECETSL